MGLVNTSHQEQFVKPGIPGVETVGRYQGDRSGMAVMADMSSELRALLIRRR